MSDVIQADSDIAKMIDGIPADDRGGSLGAPYWMEAALGEIKAFMAMDIQIDGIPTPRYGVLSLLLRSTPCFVYANEHFKKAFGTTAFTDGVHIFICEDLMKTLMDEEDASRGTEDGIVPLVMHEAMHKLMNHHERLASFPRGIANKAADYSINARIQVGYPELTWVPSLRETGIGFRPGEKEKYSMMSEESIARDLFEDELKKRQQQQQQGQGKKGSPQQGGGQSSGQSSGQSGQSQGQSSQSGQSGQGGQASQSPGQGGSSSQGKPAKGKPNGAQGSGEGDQKQPGAFGADGDEHIPDLEEVVAVMKEAGMEAALEKLGIKDAENPEDIGRVRRESELSKEEAIHKAAAQAAQMGGKYPGAHIANAASSMLVARAKGKLHWKMGVREMILGTGPRFRPSMEETTSLYYIDDMEEILGTRPWLPAELQFKPQEAVLVLVDTSGSVSDEDIKAFISEIIELKTASSGFGDAAAEVIILSADTVLRGDPQVFNDSNINELISSGLGITGRGGTDFTTSIRQAAQLKMFKDKKIKGLVYFTDLYDNPPRSKADCGLADDVNVLFVSAPSTGLSKVEDFAKKVESWARVTEIREGLQADISDTSMDMDVSPSRRPRSP